jgi:hypothetical protein
MGAKLASLQLRNGNKEFKGILVLKAEAVTGGCRKIHNEKLHSTYSRPNIVRVVKIKGKMDKACRAQADCKHILRLWLDSMNTDHTGDVNTG